MRKNTMVKTEKKPVDNGIGHVSMELTAISGEGFSGQVVRYIRHPLISGLVCSAAGREWLKQIFPEAEWVAYSGGKECEVDQLVLKVFKQRKNSFQGTPEIIAVQHQGIVLSASSALECRNLLHQVIDSLNRVYTEHQVVREVACMREPGCSGVEAQLRYLFGEDAVHVISVGLFVYSVGCAVASAPYRETVPFSAPLTAENIEEYRLRHGRRPNIVVAGDRVYALGSSRQDAEDALDAAIESALIIQLAVAFGGVRYLPEGCGAVAS